MRPGMTCIWNIQPRDAIHAVVMLNNDLTRIYSTDVHFDEIKGIERIDPINLSLKAGAGERLTGRRVYVL